MRVRKSERKRERKSVCLRMRVRERVLFGGVVYVSLCLCEKGGREMVGMASEPAYFMLQLCI